MRHADSASTVPERFHVGAVTCTVSHVGNSSLYQALEELRVEYDTVSGEVGEMQNHLAALESRLDRLRDAIQSWNDCKSPALRTARSRGWWGSDPREGSSSVRHGLTSGVDVPAAEPDLETEDGGPAATVIPESSPISKYLARGGEGRRLRSTQMVADVVDEVIRSSLAMN